MKCEQPCRGELRITNTYGLDDQKFQRAFCTTCKRVYSLETERRPVLKRGDGAKARAARRLAPLLLLVAVLLPSCVMFSPRDPVIVEARTASFDQKVLGDVIAALDAELPLEGITTVRVECIDERFQGLSWHDDGGYHISLDARQDMNGLLDTLVHEWAHCAVMLCAQENSHDSLFGVAYARAYRAMLRQRFGATEGP